MQIRIFTFKLFLLLISLCIFQGLTKAQNDSGKIPDSAFDIGYNLTVSVAMVEVTATVRNKMGRTIHNLDKDDFVIYENGEKREIVEFANARGLSKRILILLDVSGSMRIQNKIGVAKKCLKTLINTLKPDDEVALVLFADGGIEIITNFTRDKENVLNELISVHAYGKTALLDAVHAAPVLARVDESFQRSLLLITDGFDNASVVTVEEALSAARKVDLPIYSIGFDPYSGRAVQPYESRQKAIEALTVLSDQTGGRFTLAGNSVEVLAGLDQMKRDLENQYLMGFISESPNKTGNNQIEVKCKRGYDVRARQGFYSGD